MLNKDEVKKRLAALKAGGKERLDDFRTESKERLDELKVEGSDLAGRVREIIQEGTARKITIRKGDRVLAEFPLVVGVGGAAAVVMLSSTLAAVAAIGTLVSSVEVIVHRRSDKPVKAKTVEYEEIEK